MGQLLFYGEKTGKYKSFSNFSNHPIELNGYVWKTVEHYFQAQKFKGTPYFDYIRNLDTPKEAAYEGRKYPLPPNWKAIRYDIMKKAVKAKLLQHPEVAELLLSTGDQEIVENNPKDEIWANGNNNSGTNLFGKILMELRKELKNIAVLESEQSIDNIEIEDLIDRHILISHLNELPLDAFSKLRHLQPQIGCFNRCSFCSQSAGTTLWYLNERGLKNLFSALKTVGIQKAKNYIRTDGKYYLDQEKILNANGTYHEDFEMPSTGLLGYGRTNHRAGVIFCYLDNDISSYPFFEKYIKYAYEDLGVKVRISTVGYSRKNVQLQEMHQKISRLHFDKVAGVRLSVTPYTYGWFNKSGKITTQNEFELDIANFLQTYRNAIDYLGPSQRTACVEFRFKPLIETKLPYFEFESTQEHLIIIGPYALYKENPKPLSVSGVGFDSVERKMIVLGNGEEYTLYVDDSFRSVSKENFKATFESYKDQASNGGSVTLYKFQNQDGIFYTTDPLMNNEGIFSKHFYPITETRKYAGYIDSERYFLNNLLKVKQQNKIMNRRDPFDAATWDDVHHVIEEIEKQSEQVGIKNSYAQQYIDREITPIVKMYVAALEKANFAPAYFFLSTFTIDTGSICNLGQAYFEFKDIASRANLPVTPQHEKSYGTNSSLSNEGEKWRISVAPHSNENVHTKIYGKRNVLHSSPCIVIERENLALRSLGGEEGMTDLSIAVEMNNIEQLSLSEGLTDKFLIGQK